MGKESQRDLAQEFVVDTYILLDLLRCTAILSTGFGKSKIAIDVIKRLMPEKVLILVNSTFLRDTSWAAEFKTFGFEDFFKERVELVTYQTAYKWKKEEKDLSKYFVVADEVDFAGGTQELSSFFYEYPEVRILGLTGFITATKKAWFDKYLPIFKTITASNAQDQGMLNKIHFIFVKYDLSQNKSDCVVEYKVSNTKKSFMQSENDSYDYATKKLRKLEIEKSMIHRDNLMGATSREQYVAKLQKNATAMNYAIGNRTDLLYNSKTNQKIIPMLLKHIQENYPDDKTIVFSKRNEQVLNLFGEENAYITRLDEDKAKSNFVKFQFGESKLLGVCDKVNRGANIPNLRFGIFEAFDGSDTNASQRLGRLMRLRPEDTAVAFILLPYYMRKKEDGTYEVKETQQVEWARSMLSKTKIKSSEIWDYRVVKE